MVDFSNFWLQCFHEDSGWATSIRAVPVDVLEAAAAGASSGVIFRWCSSVLKEKMTFKKVGECGSKFSLEDSCPKVWFGCIYLKLFPTDIDDGIAKLRRSSWDSFVINILGIQGFQILNKASSVCSIFPALTNLDVRWSVFVKPAVENWRDVEYSGNLDDNQRVDDLLWEIKAGLVHKSRVSGIWFFLCAINELTEATRVFHTSLSLFEEAFFQFT